MGQSNMTLGIFTNNIDNRLFGHTVEWEVKKKSDWTVEKQKKKQRKAYLHTVKTWEMYHKKCTAQKE